MRTTNHVLALLLLAACFNCQATTEPQVNKQLASPDSKTRARDYFGDELLIDQDGVSKRFYSDLLSEKVVLINVIFSSCKDACPMQTQKLKATKKHIGNRFGNDIVFLSLSVDPQRDTPALLKKFAKQQGADHGGWRFLVASPEIMQKVLGRLGQWSGEPNSHSTLLIAGNARKSHWLKLRPDAPPERIAEDLLRLADQ